MSKKLYFTCPIQALYMMKEFGVKFEMLDFTFDYSKSDMNYIFDYVGEQELLLAALFYKKDKVFLKDIIPDLVKASNRAAGDDNEQIFLEDDEIEQIVIDNFKEEDYWNSCFEDGLVRFKIYVAKESEHIFEEKPADFIAYTLHGTRNVYRTFDLSIPWTPEAKDIKIIMRDNKHFFAAEVEND